MKMNFRSTQVLSVGMMVVSLALAGCKGSATTSMIQGVNVSLSSDLQTVNVAVVFASSVQSTLSASYSVGSYGDVFVQPYSATQPFEAGFQINTNIINDQKYATLTPTSVLPNGVTTGIGYPVVQVTSPTLNTNFADFVAYVDVKEGNWLGMAAIFSFATNQYFPADLSLTQVFERDSAGNPEVFASVYGPTDNSDGTLSRNGGIALFANVKELIAAKKLTPGKTASFKAELIPSVSGKNAKALAGKYDEMERLQDVFVGLLNKY